jgi:hypothetical protein
VKHTEQRGIWVPTQHLLWDQGKPRKTLIELVGRRTFRMQKFCEELIIFLDATRTAKKMMLPTFVLLDSKEF